MLIDAVVMGHVLNPSPAKFALEENPLPGASLIED